MRVAWFASVVGSLLLGLVFEGGCKAGSECGNVQQKCEAQCGGTADDNICFTYLCSEEQLVCYCKLCENIPRDLSATVDLRQKD